MSIEAVKIAVAHFLAHDLEDEALEVLAKCQDYLLIQHFRQDERVINLLRERRRGDETVVLRVRPGTPIPRNGPDDKYYPNDWFPAEYDWTGLLLIVSPHKNRGWCSRDLERYSWDETTEAMARFGWVDGGVPVFDCYTDALMDWATSTPKVEGVEVAYRSLLDMEIAHEESFTTEAPDPPEGTSSSASTSP